MEMNMLIYDESSPTCLRNSVTRQGKAVEGAVAGSRGTHGYMITIERKVCTVAQVVWELNGNPPLEHGEMIGFKDKNPYNTKISNLFLQTHERKTRHSIRENSTGYKGVSKKGSRFVATIKVKGKSVYLGTHDTPQLAHQAYLNAVKVIEQ